MEFQANRNRELFKRRICDSGCSEAENTLATNYEVLDPLSYLIRLLRPG